MLILFKDKKNISKLKQLPYSISAKDKKVMNKILNPLIKDKRVQKIFLKMIFLAFFSPFVVWKNEKLKIIIDFRKINFKLYSDAYSLSKKDIILSFLKRFEIFSSINLTKGFFQQDIDSKDYWKIIFATVHRRLK